MVQGLKFCFRVDESREAETLPKMNNKQLTWNAPCGNVSSDI